MIKENPVQSKATNSPIWKNLKLTFIFAVVLVGLILLCLYIFLSNRVYPGVSVAGINISLLPSTQAEQKIIASLDNRTSQGFEFTQNFKITLSPRDVKLLTKEAIDQAFGYGHVNFFLPPVNSEIKVEFSPSFDSQIKNIAQSVNQTPIDSQLRFADGQINVTPSQDGYALDEQAIKEILNNYINNGGPNQAILPVKKVSPKLPYSSALEIKKRLDQIKLSPLQLKFKGNIFTLSLEQLFTMVDFEGSDFSLASLSLAQDTFNVTSVKIGSEEITDTKLSLNSQKAKAYLQNLASQIDQPLKEPLFEFDPLNTSSSRIKEFQPPQEGRRLDIEKSADKINQALVTPNQTSVELVVDTIQPKNKLTNDLGIKELIGQGVSNFSGSIANRIYNLTLAASRINGVLVAPGEVFSFNKTIGDVTAATGYKQAYVIKSGRTVLDDGGGVCQVSTTLFRAVLNSGLPVTERTAHAYRVGYYEQGSPPGLDATTYYPSVDFKFKNDTGNHILIQAYTSGSFLYVNFYGTSDGRSVSLGKPTILSQTPPLPEIRQDDPTLPKGTVKQVDWSAWGANVVFTRTVTKGGETLINETFKSNYRPWQAVYLVGTKEN